ncbi:serine hydrolase domain-containing protein [Saccharothrix saharensis]|uniref:serine hydrolase domain-containing protein n=1 Tax=Saccharothrix saharensis TaxID=571190 RepID=UPI003679A44B
MSPLGATKFLTFTDVQPGATVHGWWNHANREVYRLNAWPNVAPGVTASAEITRIRSTVHGNPAEKELHFWVTNTGTTAIDIDVWALWWDWTLGPVVESIRSQSGVPALGGAVVTKNGVAALDVAGIRMHGSNVAVAVDDRWHLGSDTKAMTATLVAVLAEKGLVGWDTTVDQAFPEWAQTMNKIFKQASFERLMGHRSGIADVTSAEGTALANANVSLTQCRRDFAELITHRVHGGGLLFTTPGELFSYQNADFILAAAMV